MTERQPIISAQPIELVQSPLTLASLLPSYRYKFQGDTPQEADDMYNQLVGFIDVNDELALEATYGSRDDYIAGFSRAMALVRLWIDSLYVGQNS